MNAAVGNVDDLTQQNSSLVEQAASATASMYEQAKALARQVEVFRVAWARRQGAIDYIKRHPGGA